MTELNFFTTKPLLVIGSSMIRDKKPITNNKLNVKSISRATINDLNKNMSFLQSPRTQGQNMRPNRVSHINYKAINLLNFLEQNLIPHYNFVTFTPATNDEDCSAIIKITLLPKVYLGRQYDHHILLPHMCYNNDKLIPLLKTPFYLTCTILCTLLIHTLTANT